MAAFRNDVFQTDGGCITVILTKGFKTLVDDTPEIRDLLCKHKFCAIAHGPYAVTRGKHGLLFLHHFILSQEVGKFTDHINRDTLDNRRINLRNVTKAINALNVGLIATNKTGVVGLYRYADRESWGTKWLVSQGVSKYKSFNDAKYGGIDASRIAAIAFLKDIHASLPHYIEGMPQ